MKRTISVMMGKGSLTHNNRDFIAENVDAERTKNNVTYCNENIKNVYHELFDEALEKYNAKQTRKDRMIDDYYEKIRTGKQEKLFHEIILQIGNMEDMHATSKNGQLAKTILDKYMQGFQERNPNLRIFSAHLHMDEATPHLHIDFVPFTTDSKRGLETRVSLKKALAAQGFIGSGKRDTEWNQWVESEKENLSEIMLEYGIEWDKLGTHNKHRTVDQYKKEILENEVSQLEAEKEYIEGRINSYKNAEDYALATAKKYESECRPPEPPPLITAKTYRKKYVEPLFRRLVKCIQALARRIYTLAAENKSLKAQIESLKGDNGKLKSAKWDYQMENAKLRCEVKKFHQIEAYFGIDIVKEWLKKIKNREKSVKISRTDIEM